MVESCIIQLSFYRLKRLSELRMAVKTEEFIIFAGTFSFIKLKR